MKVYMSPIKPYRVGFPQNNYCIFGTECTCQRNNALFRLYAKVPPINESSHALILGYTYIYIINFINLHYNHAKIPSFSSIKIDFV